VVSDLVVELPTPEGPARAVDGVSFSLDGGEVVGLVGESGCGKSVTALALLGLLPPGTGRASSGRILFQGEELTTAPEKRLRDLRGNRLAMIFQEPMTALNPVLTAGEQVAEVLRRHRGLGRREAWARTEELLGEVGIPAPRERARDYPHQLSGGMRQRVMIAMAIACEPRLLIADEPTTALDVTVQAQVLRLLGELQTRTGMTILLITHDLGVVAQTCGRVLVMYSGRIVEESPVAALFEGSLHPYTRGLLASMPSPRGRGEGEPPPRLTEIPGMVPALNARPAGCVFSDRCPRARERCREREPGLEERGHGRKVRCFYPHGHGSEEAP
jgi:peptide/nickel transport system ATP-binding protein